MTEKSVIFFMNQWIRKFGYLISGEIKVTNCFFGDIRNGEWIKKSKQLSNNFWAEILDDKNACLGFLEVFIRQHRSHYRGSFSQNILVDSKFFLVNLNNEIREFSFEELFFKDLYGIRFFRCSKCIDLKLLLLLLESVIYSPKISKFTWNVMEIEESTTALKYLSSLCDSKNPLSKTSLITKFLYLELYGTFSRATPFNDKTWNVASPGLWQFKRISFFDEDVL